MANLQLARHPGGVYGVQQMTSPETGKRMIFDVY